MSDADKRLMNTADDMGKELLSNIDRMSENSRLMYGEFKAKEAEVERLKRDLEEARSEFAIISRAVGNWREWPEGTVIFGEKVTREESIAALQKRLYKECYVGHLGDEWWHALAEWVYDYKDADVPDYASQDWQVATRAILERNELLAAISRVRASCLEFKLIESELALGEQTIEVPVKWVRAAASGAIMRTCAEQVARAIEGPKQA